MEKELELYSWVVRGKQRRAVLEAIKKEDMIPTEIYKEAKKINPKMSLNTTSDVLKEFRDRKIVVCLNPKEKMGRLYRLTQKGKTIRNKLIKYQF